MNRLQLEQCIREYGREIYSFCCHLTGNVQEAEELYQDTFLKAVELMKNIDYENNPKSFLISIALRLWKNKKRKYAWRMRIAGTESLIEETVENLEAENCPEEEMIQKEIQRQVRKAVAGLEEKYRIPVYLFYTVQMSVAEISKTLKIPEGTVKTRLYKARKLLKEKLEVVLDET
ncbi:MAG: RNA polymerase sigma factor [Lachnospiraceae bacterium]|nr:RNA polymerase sigma factor [Lachnospiraceae bacterium]